MRELRNAGFRPGLSARRQTEGDYLSKLDPKLDIILSDFSMPQFNGMRALQLLKETNLDIPFILISGTIGEESAVWAMRDGAADYLLKDRLTRLGEAVKHALQEKRNREEGRHCTEEKLARLRQQHALILNSAGDGIYGIDLDGNIMFQNPKATRSCFYVGMVTNSSENRSTPRFIIERKTVARIQSNHAPFMRRCTMDRPAEWRTISFLAEKGRKIISSKVCCRADEGRTRENRRGDCRF